MNNFTVDILTPSRVVAKDVLAENVLIPTTKGQAEIMKGHTHVVEKLGTGMISIFGGPDDPDRYFSVTTGVCRVLANKIVILSNTSEESLEVNVERAQASYDNAVRILASETLSDEEIEKYRRKIERSKLRIQLGTFVRNRNI